MPSSTVLQIVQLNLNGLCSKLSLLADYMRVSKPNIVCVTESHLLEQISNSFVHIPGFALIRNDVAGSVHKHGVCAYVHESIMIDDVSTPLPNVLSFHLASFDVYIILIYRPPSNSPDDNDRLCSFISDFCTGKEVIISGDLNLPTLDWSSDNPSGASSPMERNFFDLFNSLGLTQWVTEPTYPRSGNILDLVLTSESDRIGQLQAIAPLPGCDHCPTVFHYIFSNETDPESDTATVPRRAWHKGNYAVIRQSLEATNWDYELAYRDAEDSFNHFAVTVSDLIENNVPLKPPVCDRKPPWSTRPPTGLVHQRQIAWSAYKTARQHLGRRSTGTVSAYAAFTAVNRQYRSFAVQSQVDYETSLIERSKDNPKLLHSYIRNKKVGRPSIGPLRLPSGTLTDEPRPMAELFAASFASVFTKSTPDNPAAHQLFDGTLDDAPVSTDDVLAALKDLDGNSAMGPDCMHPLFLRNCADQLAYPLHLIYDKSLREGRVPKAWKNSLVIPIFKKGPRYDPLNYRPISLTSVCCKVMERIVGSHLRNYLESNSLLIPHQFGFRSGRSTMDQLLLVYNAVSSHMDRGGVTDVILFDFSKAFDVVCHDILLAKLNSIGVEGHLLQWTSSFLTGRKMSVCAKGHISQPRDVLSGVPQGSVLGPLLFLIYINSVASNLTSSYKIFADDLKIYACVHYHSPAQPPSSVVAVQSDINVLHATAASWGLSMNRKKCAVLHFSRPYRDLMPATYFLDGQPIPNADFHEDLGIIVDTDLKFHRHVQSVSHKAGGLAQNFLRSTICRSPKFMLFLLTTHIRPIIEYASCVWHTGFQGDLRLLENIQRRWTKCIDGLNSLSYADRLQALKLYSVQGRLLRADLIQCWKLFHGESCISADDLFCLAPGNRTRGHCFKVFSPTTNTDARKRFFSIRCIAVWNSLPAETVCAPDLSCFKGRLASCISDRLYDYV